MRLSSPATRLLPTKLSLSLVACLAVSAACTQSSSAPKTEADQKQEILKVTDAVLLAMHLGDFEVEDLKPFIRDADVKIVPQAQGEGAAMMKMRTLAQLKPLREQIKSAVGDAFTLEAPMIAEDRKTATVKMSLHANKLLPLFELKTVYEVYMAQAYQEQKAGHAMPSLESVKTKVLAQGSPYRAKIEQNAEGIQKEQPPRFQLEHTEQGWRVNLEKLFGK